jgi:hypothetical protein
MEISVYPQGPAIGRLGTGSRGLPQQMVRVPKFLHASDAAFPVCLSSSK